MGVHDFTCLIFGDHQFLPQFNRSGGFDYWDEKTQTLKEYEYQPEQPLVLYDESHEEWIDWNSDHFDDIEDLFYSQDYEQEPLGVKHQVEIFKFSKRVQSGNQEVLPESVLTQEVLPIETAISRKIKAIDYNWSDWVFEPDIGYHASSHQAIWKVPSDCPNFDFLEVQASDLDNYELWVRNISDQAYNFFIDHKKLRPEISNEALLMACAQLKIKINHQLSRQSVYDLILQTLRQRYDL